MTYYKTDSSIGFISGPTPEGATEISETEYNKQIAAQQTALETLYANIEAAANEETETNQKTRETARTKLVAGEPLTEQEAALLIP